MHNFKSTEGNLMNICGFMFPESTNFNCFIFVYWGSSEKQQIYVYMCIHAQREI